MRTRRQFSNLAQSRTYQGFFLAIDAVVFAPFQFHFLHLMSSLPVLKRKCDASHLLAAGAPIFQPPSIDLLTASRARLGRGKEGEV